MPESEDELSSSSEEMDFEVVILFREAARLVFSTTGKKEKT